MIKWLKHQEAITIKNIYAITKEFHDTWSKAWQEIKGGKDKSVIVVGDFNTSLSSW